MSKKLIRGVRPTRIELLKLRRKEILAQKGHDLLEEKREAMINEFLNMTEEFRGVREALREDIREAHERMAQAQMAMGARKIREIAYAIPESAEIGISSRHIMGVEVPILSIPQDEAAHRERGYSYGATSAVLDEAADSYRRVLAHTLMVAEKENALRRLQREIDRTKRRVNVLEHIVIPQLHATQKYIEGHLEELEREDFFRRKRTKALLEKGD